MVTILMKNDLRVDGRNYYKGQSYTVTEDRAKILTAEHSGDVKLLERDGPVRRDKSIVEFRTPEHR
jgi:hypothetical protein